ncbi:MAG: glycosyltransferase family 4 protein, partial [Burkholderiales bacterium]
MRIAIVSDAWKPQVNGVVTTLAKTGETLRAWGEEVCFVTAQGTKTVPLPTYPDIRVAVFPRKQVRALLDDFSPSAIHIATEGPLGWAARSYCRGLGLKFTTSYHTRFPELLRMRAPVPLKFSYAVLRQFHGKAARTLVATESQREALGAKGFRNLVFWPRGVDSELFRPRPRGFLSDPRPIMMFVGRVAVEKNLKAFLALDVPGTKYVIGDGPDLRALSSEFPAARFPGYKFGEELASYLADADVFAFPGRTETFGMVMLEAMACGVPIAAFPVSGPRDVVSEGVTGALDEDLAAAISRALELNRDAVRDYALSRSWQAATDRF